MPVDLESLLAPLPGDDPAGPDLSYDPDRLTIESAFESSFSEGGAEKADVAWPEIIALIQRQFQRTKDLWLAVYLARAGARSGQLNVVEGGVSVLAGLLENEWPAVHPQLDEYGLQGRVTPCASLASFAEFLAPLRRTILVAHPRLGEYSGADFEQFARGGDAEEGYGQFRAALADLGDDPIVAATASLDATRDALQRADAVFNEHAPGEGPAFDPVYETIAQIRAALTVFVSPPDTQEGAAESIADDRVPATSTTGYSGGKIASREDVTRALDAIADYYRLREPASPVALVVARARAWVSLDFLTVLEDIAPGSVDEVRRVLVSQRDQAASAGWNEDS